MPTATATTGNSGTAATWTITNPSGPARVPTALDDVVVPTGVTLTITADLLCQSFTVAQATTDTTLVTTTGTFSIIVGNGALGIVLLNAAGTGNGINVTATSSGVLTIVCDYIAATAASGTKIRAYSVGTSATLTIQGDIQTAGLGTVAIGTINGTLNLTQFQGLSSNLLATTNKIPFSMSASNININVMSTGEVLTVQSYKNSALTSAAGSFAITPYGGDVAFVSAQPAASGALNTSTANYRQVGQQAGA